MEKYEIISADTHIMEPPDMYSSRIDPRFRDQAPQIKRKKTEDGRDYDAWYYGDIEIIRTGAVSKAGQRFEDPDQLDQIGTWEEVNKAAYDPHEMIKGLEMDGIWGGILQPSAGLQMYRVSDNELLAAINRSYNDFITDFCRPYPARLKAIGCIDVENVEDACRELERCAKLGFVGVFIPTYPLPDHPYSDPKYEPLWALAQDLNIPLLLHIGTNRDGIPGCEFTMDTNTITPVGLSTFDHWVRSSLTAMIFAGVFERYPRLHVGTVEHEAGWVPFWLKQMDYVYKERVTFRGSWRSQEGMGPSDYWKRNLFVSFMEDEIGVQLRHMIGVENMMWGNDFPHHESTWPESMNFLDRIFAGVPDSDRRQITRENAIRMFGFDP